LIRTKTSNRQRHVAIMQTYILLMKYIYLSRHFKIELKCRSLTIKNQATAKSNVSGTNIEIA
jgi:hypothetical protein